MTEEQRTPYLVDLTREEYIEFAWQMARTLGPLRYRTGQLAASLVCSALVAALTVYDWYLTQQPDWLLLGLSVLLAVLAIGFWAYMPIRLRRRAGKEYDRMTACGYTYVGELQITDSEVLKVSDEITTRVRLDGSTMFVETETMLIFLGKEQRAIVLPARCLTKEMATTLRAAADRLSVSSRRFLGRLQPQEQAVTAAPHTPMTVLWEQTVQYNTEETVAILKARTVQQFWTRLPVTTAMSVMLALAFGWSDTSIWPSVMSFFGVLAVLTVLNLVLPLTRLRRMQRAGYAPVPGGALHVTFTDRGVRMLEQDRYACVPWEHVQHVYDRGDYAEILWDTRSIRIPKRCIPDIEAFDSLLRQVRNYNK